MMLGSDEDDALCPEPLANDSVVVEPVKILSAGSLVSDQDLRSVHSASDAVVAELCEICSTKLGKRHLNPRFRCNSCRRLVCAACSPSTIQGPDQAKAERACTICASEFQQKCASFLTTTFQEASGSSQVADGSLASNCEVCNARLGKRYLNPRHTCGMCSKCICGSCSPTSIQVEGQKEAQRICAPCAKGSQIESISSFLAPAPVASFLAPPGPSGKHLIVPSSSLSAPGQPSGSFLPPSPRGAQSMLHAPPSPRGGYPSPRDAPAANCEVCAAKLGKRHLNPKQECWTCKRAVCGSCSPGSLQLDGRLQRVCTPCGLGVRKVQEVTAQEQASVARLARIEEQLLELMGRIPLQDPGSLPEAIASCEKAMSEVAEHVHDGHDLG